MNIEKTYGPKEYLELLEKLVEQTKLTSDVLTEHLELQTKYIALQKDYIFLFNLHYKTSAKTSDIQTGASC